MLLKEFLKIETFFPRVILGRSRPSPLSRN
jgi:hypothetical protein